MELWTDAHVPAAFSASPTGEALPVLPVGGQEQSRGHPVRSQELRGDVDLVSHGFKWRCPWVIQVESLPAVLSVCPSWAHEKLWLGVQVWSCLHAVEAF